MPSFSTTRAKRARIHLHASAAGLSFFAPPALAAEAPFQVAAGQFEQVYVWGRREDRIGMATTASEGIVGFATFEDRPTLRPGEVALTS